MSAPGKRRARQFRLSFSRSTGPSLDVYSRSQSLQRAKMAYNGYRNDYDNLNSWLSRVPNYEPRESDDVKQVETKLRNQKVRLDLV